MSHLHASRSTGLIRWMLVAGLLTPLSGCAFSKAEQPQAGQQQNQQPAAVDATVVRSGQLESSQEFTGTTQPVRQVSLRSQVEGQLLNLYVAVGDSVKQGQVLAEVDGEVLGATVVEAQAEVAALQSEVAAARNDVSDAQNQADQAQIELQQAQSDLTRLEFLARQGAIPDQQAEQARTRVGTARQVLQSAQARVRTRREAVAAAQGRVNAQRAVVAREQQRQSFTTLTSPVTGLVVEQPSEAGNLVQPGNEVLKLADFSQIKVIVQLSELELGGIRVGQSVKVRLDAFPNREFTGRISRLSPAADPIARLVPVEVIIPNPNGQIGSGLLARVTLPQQQNRPRILVPETALLANQDPKARQGGGGQNSQGGGAQNPQGGNRSQSSAQKPSNSQSERGIGTIFVVNESNNGTTVSLRQVTLGRRSNSQVEVLDGLRQGDRIVARSSRALKDGDAVRLSVISENPGQTGSDTN